MAVEISLIKNTMLQQVAASVDANKDKKLSGDEYSVFAQNAMKQGATYKQVSEALDMNAFQRWWFDVDKVSTDGKDDGHLSFGEKAESFGKGIANLIKAPIKNPIATAVTVGVAGALTFATGGAAIPIIIGAGAAFGAIEIGKGVYNAATAETDTDAKKAFESIGTGTATVALSALGVKSANKAGANAGIKSLQGLENAGWKENVVAMAKAMPEAFKQSGLNIKGNALTWTSAIKGDNVIYANSNKLRALGQQHSYMSKANDVEAYKFNPNGTTEEILANNPHVEQVNGKFGVQDKWATQSLQEAITGNPEKGIAPMTEQDAILSLKLDPSKVSNGKVYHLIDPNKNPMVMIYDEAGNDFAICEGNVFKGSYVDTKAYRAEGTLNYQDPSKLAYGQRIRATKQAPGSFISAPEGTKVQTVSEGVQTVQKGQVVALDHEGNPYVTTVENIIKRNTGLSDNAMQQLYDVNPAVVAKRATEWTAENHPEFLLETDPDALALSGKMKVPRFYYEDSQSANFPILNKYLEIKGIKIIDYVQGGYQYENGSVTYLTADGQLHSWTNYEEFSTLIEDFLKLVVKGEIK